MATDKLVVLFDVGATHTRVAVAHKATAFSAHETFLTDHSEKGIIKLITALRSLSHGSHLVAIVGGIVGHVDEQGRLQGATNLPAWNGLNLGDKLEAALDVPVHLENDTAMVGLGEAHFGAGRGHRIMMYETVSTGVNATCIVEGKIVPSTRGVEVGHELIAGPGGTVTSLEAATGGAALEAKYGHKPQELHSQSLWRAEAGLLAEGLYNSLLHWGPEVVVFGGSMMHDISLDDIAASLKKLGEPDAVYPPLVAAKLGDNGGLYGGLALAQQLGYLS